MEVMLPPIPGRGVSAGTAYWNQRHRIGENRQRFEALFSATASPNDLCLYQWAQLAALTMEFEPDVIIELGRGRGNSTCMFTEAVHLLGGRRGSVVSLCRSSDWHETTRPRLAGLVGEQWFAPLTALTTEIVGTDYARLVAGASRVLVFWDAHGFTVAESVLGGLLPAVAGIEHLVIMHDLSDARFASNTGRYYGRNRLWTGNDWSGPRLRLGHIDTAVEQGIAVMDFASRNDITLQSADWSIRTEIGGAADRVAEMTGLLGEGLFSLQAHWFYFSLNERAGMFTFPCLPKTTPAGPGASGVVMAGGHR